MPDLLEAVEKKFGARVASRLATLLAIAFVIFFAWVLFSSSICENGCWREIDFSGRGGNPQQGYMDDY